MPDPILTPGNCIGATCSVTLGFDPTSLNPNQLLAILNKDERTIECADGIGTRVKICGEDAEIPFAARSVDFPSSNLLRVQQDADGNPCGLTVMPKQIEVIGTSDRVALAQNNVTTDDPVTVDGVLIQTIPITNTDSVKRLFSARGRFSVIIEIDDDNEDAEGQFIMRTRVNNNAGDRLATTGGVPFIGGGNLNSRVVTFTYPGGPYGGRTLNDQRDFLDEVILDPGQTRYLHYYTSTIRTMNVLTPGSSSPFRGVNIVGVTVHSEQVREG